MFPKKIRTSIICLLVASIFWLFNALNKDGYSTNVAYPIQLLYDDARYIPTTELPKKIKVNLSSTGWNLLRNNLSFRSIPLVYEIVNPLKISSLSAKSLKEKLNAHLHNAVVNEVDSENLAVSFEPKITKKVVLKIDAASIDLQKNTIISSQINIVPNLLILEGPKSVLANFQDTLFIKISAKKISSNFDEKIAIDLPQHPFVKANISKIMVSFEVAELLKK